jgi:hypothetical protein
MPKVKRAAQAVKPVVLKTHRAKPLTTLAAAAMPMVSLAVLVRLTAVLPMAKRAVKPVALMTLAAVVMQMAKRALMVQRTAMPPLLRAQQAMKVAQLVKPVKKAQRMPMVNRALKGLLASAQAPLMTLRLLPEMAV